MKEIKCPVCGKVGIKDYHNEDIKCPCCGSDLSIFRVIDQIPNKKQQRTSAWKIISCALIASFLVVGWYSVNLYHSNTATKQELSLMQDSILVLKESVKTLEAKTIQKVEPQVYYKHVVRPGDNLWKISYRYYNTGRRYTDIAKWNNIEVNSTISVGDTLIIR